LGTIERALRNRKVVVGAVSLPRISGWLAEPPGASVPAKRCLRRCPILRFHAGTPRTSILQTRSRRSHGRASIVRPDRGWRAILIPAANVQSEYRRAEPRKASGKQPSPLHEVGAPAYKERDGRPCFTKCPWAWPGRMPVAWAWSSTPCHLPELRTDCWPGGS
jgi:hypothetical protein